MKILKDILYIGNNFKVVKYFMIGVCYKQLWLTGLL